jgi:hypothetical protein
MKNNETKKSHKDAFTEPKDKSWFKNDPYRWSQASLPFAYATACVEVVINESGKAREIYSDLVKAWGKTNTKDIYEKITAEVPESEKERVKEAFLHPEKELYPDPNKPFIEFEKIVKSFDLSEADLEAIDKNLKFSKDDLKEFTKMFDMVILYLEFVKVGFNRETDVDKDKLKVSPLNQVPWLMMAVLIKSIFDYYGITIEKLSRFFNVKKYKGKVIDFHKVLTEETMSRWHRKLVASGKAVNMTLKNDRTIKEAAEIWYQCRVVYSSVAKYCDAQSEKGILLNPKNIEGQIKPCDKAVGYVGRLKR